MRTSKNWTDYQLLDAGDKEKLEKIKDTIIQRPDPVALWNKSNPTLWKQSDATYIRSNQGGGQWQKHKKIKEHVDIRYDDMVFICSLTNFKHIGLFPEQAVNWDWIKETITNSSKTQIKALNLFGYTGAATVALARLDQVSEVVHVDAAKGMVAWCKNNIKKNKLEHKKVRYLVDDVTKFVQREIRRENTYDIVILDPPSYGRGPNNEIWRIEDQLMDLLHNIKKLLSKQPMFVILNSYTSNLSPTMIENIMHDVFNDGEILADEIGISYHDSSRVLPAGVCGIWQASK